MENKNEKEKQKRYTCFHKQFWLNKGFSEEEAIHKVHEIQNKIREKQTKEVRSKRAQENSPMRKETWISKGYSEEDAIYKIKTFRKCNIEYWESRGYSHEDAILEKNKFQSASSKSQKRKDDQFPNQVKYWLKKGFSEEEAKEKVSNFQHTFSLEKCIQRLGEEEGKKRFDQRQEKWKSKVYNKDRAIGYSISLAQEEIAKFLIDRGIDILWGNNEKIIWSSDLQRPLKYDVCNQEKRRIIEYHGNFWHMNPTLYEADYIHPVTKQRAGDKWQFDKIKLEEAIKHGYEVMIVWEEDFKHDKQQIFELCLAFMKK